MKKLALLLLSVFLLTACGSSELKIGQLIDSTATITRNTYEHPIDPPPGYPYAAYARLNGEETVLYSKEAIKCQLGQSIKFSGRVREVKGAPEGSDKEISESHVALQEFECTGEAYQPDATGTNVTEVENIFKNKVVYGTGLDEQDPKPYIENCEARGGTFNACGSPCAPDAEFCIEVCAYTCEFENN